MFIIRPRLPRNGGQNELAWKGKDLFILLFVYSYLIIFTFIYSYSYAYYQALGAKGAEVVEHLKTKLSSPDFVAEVKVIDYIKFMNNY